MRTGSAVAAVALAVTMSFAVVGCESSNSTPPDQNSGYAGGNGSFGEDPAQPGEHSKQRFDRSGDDASSVIPSTQPSR